jgi:hypothetical protein
MVVVSTQMPMVRPTWSPPIQICWRPTVMFPVGVTVRSSANAEPPSH